MGSDRGFFEIERFNNSYQPVEERIKHYNEFTIRPDRRELESQGGALHGLRYTLLPRNGLSAREPDSRMERPGVQG